MFIIESVSGRLACASLSSQGRRRAALAYGEQLIAIILTGAGSDGAAGARAVKAAGGVVIIENPATTAYPGMPESLAMTTVDFVSDLERMAPLSRSCRSGAMRAMQLAASGKCGV
jgi:chemotaxis response regulator CheB